MKKKIIFFDGDGTLWYPKSTGRSVKPWWIYTDESTKEQYLEHLGLDPETKPLLRALRKLEIKTVILSTVPAHKKDPQKILTSKVMSLGLGNLVDDYIATAEIVKAKGEKILELLKFYGFKPSEALMVGDSYEWDYLSARNAGIPAFLLECQYHTEPYIGTDTLSSLQEIYNTLV